jgi:hypothetical protein
MQASELLTVNIPGVRVALLCTHDGRCGSFNPQFTDPSTICSEGLAAAERQMQASSRCFQVPGPGWAVMIQECGSLTGVAWRKRSIAAALAREIDYPSRARRKADAVFVNARRNIVKIMHIDSLRRGFSDEALLGVGFSCFETVWPRHGTNVLEIPWLRRRNK